MIDDDDLLLAQACSGESYAFASLLIRYRGELRRCSRAFFAPGVDFDDFMQEAQIGFFKAVRDFNAQPCEFKTFMRLCVRRQLVSFLRKVTRRKAQVLSRALSLDMPLNEEQSAVLIDILPSIASNSDFVEERYTWTVAAIAKMCTKREREVLLLYCSGNGYSEISSRLSIPKKAIRNALWRARCKAIQAGLIN